MEKMQKLNFPGTHLRGLALILDRRPQKNPDVASWHGRVLHKIPKFCVILIESAKLASKIGFTWS